MMACTQKALDRGVVSNETAQGRVGGDLVVSLPLEC